ncbi:MAG: hypothetical protein LUH45_03905 [Clostridiales bacterium]|nr:hypothetical protein [Clostridiales bacterium]
MKKSCAEPTFEVIRFNANDVMCEASSGHVMKSIRENAAMDGEVNDR